jgi:hypothetical protein
MPVLLVAVLDDPGLIWEVLDEWEKLGISDATIFDSTGLHRAQPLREDLPLFPSVRDLLEATHTNHRTLWSVVADSVDLDAVAQATERVVGSLSAPHTGILFAVPVVKTWGIPGVET